MTKSLIVFNEPELEFRYEQRVQDPRDGLALFGPCDADQPSHQRSLTYIVIGTDDGIAKFNTWSNMMNHPSTEAPKGNQRLWPPFPGFEAAFCSNWPSKPVWSFSIDRDTLIQTSRRREPHERAFGVVEQYLEGLRIASKLDENIGIAVCIVPDEVWLNCRPESHVAEPLGQAIPASRVRSRKSGQLEMFEEFDPEQYWLSPDFRRQLKARSMKNEIPLQIIRESTLRPNNKNQWGQRALTPLSDRMWNIGTTIYYKCGGKPWRLVTARDGVCYIGIAFRRTGDGNTACCAAQMFLNTGDGVIFLLDEKGPWYSPKTKEFHLSRSAAHDLLQGVLKTYKDLGGKELTEIFLHSRSTINDEEFEGYQQACPGNVRLVGVRVHLDKDGQYRNKPRLFRTGSMPVLRGTFWRLNNRAGLLWGSGFSPRIATYDGWEVPLPLRIDIQHGDAPIERVAQDILGLTKLNYNACHLGDAEPVTIRFSDAVGEILVSNPTVHDHKPNFKFYI
jgi:hypothetical protein